MKELKSYENKLVTYILGNFAGASIMGCGTVVAYIIYLYRFELNIIAVVAGSFMAAITIISGAVKYVTSIRVWRSKK